MPHELSPEVVEASRAATAPYSLLTSTIDHETHLQANASSLGAELQHTAFFSIAATEPVDRLRQHCVCIHTGAMDEQDETALQCVLEQTLEPLFQERRAELCVNKSEAFSAAAVKAVPAAALATTKLFRWIRQHVVAQQSRMEWLPAHFSANRHHLSRIVQGLASASPQFVDTERGLMRAWVHECGVLCWLLTWLAAGLLNFVRAWSNGVCQHASSVLTVVGCRCGSCAFFPEQHACSRIS